MLNEAEIYTNSRFLAKLSTNYIFALFSELWNMYYLPSSLQSLIKSYTIYVYTKLGYSLHKALLQPILFKSNPQFNFSSTLDQFEGQLWDGMKSRHSNVGTTIKCNKAIDQNGLYTMIDQNIPFIQNIPSNMKLPIEF